MPDDIQTPRLSEAPMAASGVRPAHHTRRGFRNPPGSPRDHGTLGHLWVILRYLWLTRHVPRQPEVPDGFVLPVDVVIAGNALVNQLVQADVAANNTENMSRLKVTNPAAAEKIKVIWTSPLIPSDPIVWRKDLPEESKAKIKEFFLTYGTDKSTGDVAHEKEVLAGLEWAPFRASNDDQLLPIRVMELQKSIAKIQGDASLSDADKKAQVDKLEAQKAEFEQKLKANQS